MIGVFLFTQLIMLLILGLNPEMSFKEKIQLWFFASLFIILLFITAYCLTEGI